MENDIFSRNDILLLLVLIIISAVTHSYTSFQMQKNYIIQL